jgi:anthranilate phosphoribosyltransferase
MDPRSPLQRALAALAARRTLGADEVAAAFGEVMRGDATPAQAALLLGRACGRTADEIAGAARPYARPWSQFPATRAT